MSAPLFDGVGIADRCADIAVIDAAEILHEAVGKALAVIADDHLPGLGREAWGHREVRVRPEDLIVGRRHMETERRRVA